MSSDDIKFEVYNSGVHKITIARSDRFGFHNVVILCMESTYTITLTGFTAHIKCVCGSYFRLPEDLVLMRVLDE